MGIVFTQQPYTVYLFYIVWIVTIVLCFYDVGCPESLVTMGMLLILDWGLHVSPVEYGGNIYVTGVTGVKQNVDIAKKIPWFLFPSSLCTVFQPF